jgi:hypothetical protein
MYRIVVLLILATLAFSAPLFQKEVEALRAEGLSEVRKSPIIPFILVHAFLFPTSNLTSAYTDLSSV